jgi:hypothetical protein
VKSLSWIQVAGKVVLHMGEQQIISTVQDLKADGMTLRYIAQVMTVLGIPSENVKVK